MKQSNMKLIVVNHARLIPLEDNPRKLLDKEGGRKLVGLIDKHGFQNPLQVWRDRGAHPDDPYVILCGNHRFAAGLELGMERFPCVEYSGTRTEALSRAVSDNKSSEWTGWDDDRLKKILEEISNDDCFDLDTITGYSAAELDDLLDPDLKEKAKPTKEDKAPEVNEEDPPLTRPGDIWILGGHRIMCGDSTDKENVAELMAGARADMVFTDPPYGMNLDTDFSTMKNSESAKSKRYDRVLGDDKDYDPAHIFRDFGYCKEMFLWGADYYAERLVDKNKGSWLIWDKREGIEKVKYSLSEFETCWSKAKHARVILRFRWFGMLGTEQAEEDIKKRVHPNQKPVKMFLKIIEAFSVPGALVVDPFLGSGSTLIACEKLGRACYGFEMLPVYCDVIIKRWAEYTGQDPIRHDGVKWSALI